MVEVIGFNGSLELAMHLIGQGHIAQPPTPTITGADMHPTSRAMRRDEHARHNRKVARIQCGSDRLLWCSSVLVRSLKV
jgi:hypothetical protein